MVGQFFVGHKLSVMFESSKQTISGRKIFTTLLTWIGITLNYSLGIILPRPHSTFNTTSMNGFVELGDLHGVDSKILHELSHHVSNNLRRHNLCAMSQKDIDTAMKFPLHALNTKYIDNNINIDLPIGGQGIVSPPRKRATALLSKAALTLPTGDFVETGSYIGTSAIIMLRILRDFDRCHRKLWIFDSFEGLPLPTKEDHNQGVPGQFFVTVDNFTTNLKFADVYAKDNPVITKGWFKDTVGVSAVKQISFLRLDGDLFESTWDAITGLYDRVVPGGIIYVDDYGSFVGCARAVEKFRLTKKIYEPLHYVQERGGNPLNQEFPIIIFEAVWWVKRND